MMDSLEMSIDGFATLSHHIHLPIQEVFENYECESTSYSEKPRWSERSFYCNNKSIGFLFLYFGCKSNLTQQLKDVGSSQTKLALKACLIFTHFDVIKIRKKFLIIILR